MILVLLAAAALSFFAGGGQDWLDTAIILLIVVFNTVISVSQEDNARKALEALEKLAAPRARVLREGVERRLESTHLVPGDILLLEAGDYVPADGRILWAAGLQTDESAMTGESLPVHKRAGDGLPPDTPLAERKNMVIGGTVVTGGRAKVVVTATGMQTEMGKIAGLLLRQGQGETPLQRKMKEVSRVLSLVCVGVCAVMFGVGMLQHRDILDMFLTAVALAVAAILLYTAPTFVVILSAILWKDKITKRKLLALVLAFLGCCFVAGILNGQLTLTTDGLLLGIGSGLFYSSYTIFGRFALKHYQPFTVTFYTFLIAGIGSLFMTNAGDLYTTFHSPQGILLSLGLMVCGTVLPYILYTKGLNDLGDSGKASILASVEPVVASLVGILAFGEPMTLGVVLGLVCILASVYILR